MSPLLAQSTPSAQSFASFVQVLEVAGWLAVIVTAIIVAWKQVTGKSEETTIKGQPVEVKKHAGIVTREEWADADLKVHGRIKRERAELDARIARVEEVAAERADKLEGKIDANTSLTAAMSGEVKQINQNVGLVLTALTRK